MKYLRSIDRLLHRAVMAAACWGALVGVAWAKKGMPQEEAASTGGTWTMSYFLLVMAVSLGLLVVCRSSRRRDRAKPEQYKSTKISEQYK
jgi:heme/copper-type cytochrome/quinol oxidase subunit 2